mgnify:CR=1 FL=1
MEEKSHDQTHHQIHDQFVVLGRQRNRITYELLALLPRIYEQGIYKEHKCATISEYAGRFGGLSKFVVEKTLKLHENLKNKPSLQAMIATEGVHKVALIAHIATPETDNLFAQKVKDMSRPALQELSKELRKKIEINDEVMRNVEARTSCLAAQESLTVSLDPEMQFLFLNLKKELEKMAGVGLSNREALKRILRKMSVEKVGSGNALPFSNDLNDVSQKRERETSSNIVSPQKDENGKNFSGEKLDRVGEKLSGKTSGSRNIPAAVKREALAGTGGKCAYPRCCRPVEHLHHAERFALSHNHRFIIPFCKIHHEFAHNGLIINEKMPSERWLLSLNSNANSNENGEEENTKKVRIDLKYRKYRAEARSVQVDKLLLRA